MGVIIFKYLNVVIVHFLSVNSSLGGLGSGENLSRMSPRLL